MKNILQYLNTNVLIKIASLNSITVVIKIIAGFLTSKVIAIFLGAEGLALVGNLRNFVTAAQSFSILGLYNGVIKYVAQFKNNAVALTKTLSTVYYLGFISTFLVSFLCYFNADLLSSHIFQDFYDFAYIIKIFAIALPFYALNRLVFAILNGLSKFKHLIFLNGLGQVFGATITILLIWQRQLEGALIAVVTTEALLLLITLIALFKQKGYLSNFKLRRFSLQVVKQLSSYSGMALFSALLIPFVALSIRTYIIDTVSLEDAGMWEAITRISKYYLMFIGSLLTLYVLPRFSEVTTDKGFRKEVFHFYKTIMPIFGLGLIIIYFLRHFIVQILFTKEFIPVEDLFLWQLLGDFVKVLALVISYQFIAKKMFWHYILTEAFSLGVLYFSSLYFIDHYGVKGATIAHFVTYVLYYSIVLLIFGTSLFGNSQEQVADV
ncbi:O-antigen translocase [Bizionia gelidisalsuginis]|uniref:O-antigen translocase n=1 Tax=Bizionia gelidisalsuginis TaxID=291188 RepID=A0ABY3MD46_9FLAO|nr:O-antigen translocase [Bizionia gelidisalsuginis]TYC16308.1 O-antigen translocase [Bizionia gelidisalsuginis]